MSKQQKEQPEPKVNLQKLKADKKLKEKMLNSNEHVKK